MAPRTATSHAPCLPSTSSCWPSRPQGPPARARRPVSSASPSPPPSRHQAPWTPRGRRPSGWHLALRLVQRRRGPGRAPHRRRQRPGAQLAPPALCPPSPACQTPARAWPRASRPSPEPGHRSSWGRRCRGWHPRRWCASHPWPEPRRIPSSGRRAPSPVSVPAPWPGPGFAAACWCTCWRCSGRASRGRGRRRDGASLVPGRLAPAGCSTSPRPL
mmetsp:Transcript_88501/g.274946  ORF Transcript_88501/g.274946 Transcript_88501/m.274946 type:complete len:216 (+) Transcript_88501:178-825(+)